MTKQKKLLTTMFPDKAITFDEESGHFGFDLDAKKVPALLRELLKQKVDVYEIFKSAQTLEDFFHQTIK